MGSDGHVTVRFVVAVDCVRSSSLVLQELIQTERDYVTSLRFVIDNYIPEMSRDDVIEPLRGKRGVIFGNIEKIYRFHSRSFLYELEACQQTPLRVVDAFLNHVSDRYHSSSSSSSAVCQSCCWRTKYCLYRRLSVSVFVCLFVCLFVRVTTVAGENLVKYILC